MHSIACSRQVSPRIHGSPLHSFGRMCRACGWDSKRAVGDLLRFLALIASPQDSSNAVSAARVYVSKALWYLSGRYDRPISIQETADFVGLSRSYLYRLMETECGCSPKDALLRIRMSQAARLLTTTALTLEEIAPASGCKTAHSSVRHFAACTA